MQSSTIVAINLNISYFDVLEISTILNCLVELHSFEEHTFPEDQSMATEAHCSAYEKSSSYLSLCDLKLT